MSVEVLELEKVADCDDLAGRFLDRRHYDKVVDFDADVVDQETGKFVARLRRSVLPFDASQDAYRHLRTLHSPPTNRGLASGIHSEDIKQRGSSTVRVDPARSRNPSGVLQRQSSCIIGFLDRNPRFPYCRASVWQVEHPQAWLDVIPYIQAVSTEFRGLAPEEWEAQNEAAQEAHPAFVIPSTVFTTVTVNKNWQTACHKDPGNMPGTLACMTVFSAGDYEGGLLILPEYRIAVDVRTTDMFCMDNQGLWHGNSPIKGIRGRFERVSCVFYFRWELRHSLSPEEELAYAKNRKAGDPLWPEARLAS